MIKVKLDNGFTCEISDEALDDYELFEDLVSIEDEPNRLPSVMRRLIGRDGYEELKEANRVDGRVSTVAMTDSLKEILQAVRESKKN